MQFNPGDSSGLVDEILDLCDATTTSYAIKKITRRVNAALEEMAMWALNASGTWQFDDPNFTDLPVGTGTLIEGQYSYSFAEKFWDIEWIKVKDAQGHWHIIKPWDQAQTDEEFEEYYAKTGFPVFYDKEGDTIKFGPAPTASAVTLASGLKIKWKRTISPFVYTDTTKEPGVISAFHITVARMAALPYCKTYKKDRVPALMIDIANDKREFLKFYARRQKDERNIMGTRKIRPR